MRERLFVLMSAITLLTVGITLVVGGPNLRKKLVAEPMDRDEGIASALFGDFVLKLSRKEIRFVNRKTGKDADALNDTLLKIQKCQPLSPDVRLSPNGELLLHTSIYDFDPEGPRERTTVWKIGPAKPALVAVLPGRRFQFSSTGRYLALEKILVPAPDGYRWGLELWDMKRRRRIAEAAVQDETRSPLEMTFSADERLVYVVGKEHVLEFEIATGKKRGAKPLELTPASERLVCVPNDFGGLNCPFDRLALSADDLNVMGGTDRDSITIWDEKNEVVARLDNIAGVPAKKDLPTCVFLLRSPTGKHWIAIGLPTMHVERVIPPMWPGQEAVKKEILEVDAKKVKVSLWDASTRKRLYDLPMTNLAIPAWASDGKILAIVEPMKAVFYDVEQRELIGTFDHSFDRVHKVQFAPIPRLSRLLEAQKAMGVMCRGFGS